MRGLSLFLTLPLAVAIVIFAVRNRAATALDLWPLPYVIDAPAFLLLFGGMALGLGLAGMVLGFQLLRWRGRARRYRRRVLSLEQAMERQRGSDTPPLNLAAWPE